MSKPFLPSKTRMARISTCLQLSLGVPRVDDRRVVSGIVYLIRNGLQWKSRSFKSPIDRRGRPPG